MRLAETVATGKRCRTPEDAEKNGFEPIRRIMPDHIMRHRHRLCVDSDATGESADIGNEHIGDAVDVAIEINHARRRIGPALLRAGPTQIG